MERTRADAFVFFGATGDLAFKKIFPALNRLVRSGRFRDRIIGVAKAGWDRDRLVERAKQSLTAFGEWEKDSFQALASRLDYIDGDYEEPSTFQALKKKLEGAAHPLHYLAIPPSLFEQVVRSLAETGCTQGASVVVEKPFGHDLASAQELNRALRSAFPDSKVYRIDHFLGKEPVENLSYFRFANEIFEPIWDRQHIDHVQLTLAEQFGVAGRGSFYDRTGAIRDVLQNHLLQIVANLAMGSPPRGESTRQARARTIRSIVPLRPRDVVRGQFQGYLDEPGVSPHSTVETYCAARLTIDDQRWAGVPFLIRSGKRLPVTVTEAFVVFRSPPREVLGASVPKGATYLRYRVGPDVTIAWGLLTKKPGAQLECQKVELVAHSSQAEAMTEYERLIHDALEGDHELFATEAGVEAAWRVVGEAIAHPSPIEPYPPGSWGPPSADRLAADVGGWRPLAPGPPGAKSP